MHATPQTLAESDTLDAAPVLPGFTLAISDWFARAGQQAAP
jgi:hypothetical protein